FAGWKYSAKLWRGRTDFELRLNANREGASPNNDAAAWDAFTNGRVTHVDYGYASVAINRSTPQPRGWSRRSPAHANVAAKPLPDPGQLTLGGPNGVRGYGTSDAMTDTGIVLRNEVRSPVWSAPAPPWKPKDPRRLAQEVSELDMALVRASGFFLD